MYRERIYGVAAKIETTSGTDSVPTAGTNAVQVVGVPILEWDFLEPGDRDDVQNGTLVSADRAEPGGRFGKISLRLELKGKGDAAGVPDADVFWRGAGFSKTVVATPGSETVSYATLDDAMETFTLYLWSIGRLYKLVSCVAVPKLILDAGKRGFLEFTVMGRMASDPTQVAVPALTFATTKPLIFRAATAGIGAWLSTAGSDPLVLQHVDVDFGTVAAERPSAGATDGFIGYLIGDRKVTQTMELEVPAIASFDADALAKAAGSTMPTTQYGLGSVQYSRLLITTGRWGLKPPKIGAKNTIATHTLSGRLGAGEATTGRDILLVYS